MEAPVVGKEGQKEIYSHATEECGSLPVKFLLRVGRLLRGLDRP